MSHSIFLLNSSPPYELSFLLWREDKEWRMEWTFDLRVMDDYSGGEEMRDGGYDLYRGEKR